MHFKYKFGLVYVFECFNLLYKKKTMFLIVLALVSLAGWGDAQSTDDCPAGVPRDTNLKINDGVCIQFLLDIPQDYVTAESYCANHGGTLLLVKTQAVSDYIIDQLVFEYSNTNKVWIGLTDRVKEGTFEWADGTPVGDFVNWAPNNGPLNNSTSGTFQDCVSLDPNRNGLWEDGVCSNAIFGIFLHEQPYICQYRLRVRPTTQPAA